MLDTIIRPINLVGPSNLIGSDPTVLYIVLYSRIIGSHCQIYYTIILSLEVFIAIFNMAFLA